MTDDMIDQAEFDRLFIELSRMLETEEPTSEQAVALRIVLAGACADRGETESARYQLEELLGDVLRAYGPGSEIAIECGHALGVLLDEVGDPDAAARARDRARG